MQDVHPPDRLGIADLPQVDLRSLQVLMTEDDLGDDLQRDPVPAGIGG